MNKEAWREELKCRRAALPPAVRREAARRIAACVCALPETAAARTIALYAGLPDEVATARLALLLHLSGKELALPVVERGNKYLHFRRLCHWHELRPGPFGLRQPSAACPLVEPGEMELAIVPGLGFDRLGYRLGYGGGYYDRYLPLLRPACAKVGLAFACQVVDELPHASHDARVDAVVTEAEVIRCEDPGPRPR
ncbi:MAG: 5-formyltetrahydrofolate cyclo-ligase [Bacteroidota bacterium]